jgi:hypothetical protein
MARFGCLRMSVAMKAASFETSSSMKISFLFVISLEFYTNYQGRANAARLRIGW